ncbi:MAG: hypothetical protein OQL09_00960 [Gammaproteobacteria bacterium]|nr:hypothetical protein [Gammaproteobacteria bacterium]
MFVGSFSFDPGTNGLEEFRRYLEQTENTPARILVDVIEEDFRKDTIPHVYGADRKAVIHRLIEKQYRKSVDYSYYKITGRETKGRKDDKLLYSVLTNPKILTRWLSVIEETNTAISGIWSLPLISENILKLVTEDKDNVLLVSQQVPSNLRQSYFHDGKFEISRSAVVNIEEIPLGQYIAEEVEQTSRYLANQRYIGFDDAMTIHVICHGEEIAEIKKYCVDSSLTRYVYHDLNDVYKKAGCNDLNEDYCNGLYAYYCKEKILPVGNYGPSHIFSRFYEQVAKKAINYLSVIILMTSFFGMFSYLTEASEMKKTIDSTNQLTEIVKNNYEKNIKIIETKLARTTEMKSAVLFKDYLDKLKAVSPQNFMITLSQIMSAAGINNVEIDNIEWSRTNGSIKSTTIAGRDYKIEYGSAQPVKHYAVIKGRINNEGLGFKVSVNKMQAMINTIKFDKSIEELEIVKLPQDTRPESTIENTQGASVEMGDAARERSHFEIKLIMKGI